MKGLVEILLGKNSRKLWLAVIICGALFGFFYHMIVMPDLENRFRESKQTIGISENEVITYLDIPQKDTYLLRLKNIFQERARPAKIFVNNHLLEEYISKRRGNREITYKIIPANIVHEGRNELKIIYSDNPPPELKIRFRDYRERVIKGKFFILFDSSRHLPKDYLKMFEITLIKMCIAALFLWGIWLLSSYVIVKISYLPSRRTILHNFISYIPCLLILALFYLASLFSPYYIVLSPSYFWTLSIELVGILTLSLTLWCLWTEHKKGNRFIESSFLYRLVKQLKGMPLANKFIISFIFLLVVAALLLINRGKSGAEVVMNWAYLLLGIGIFLKLVQFIKEARKNEINQREAK